MTKLTLGFGVALVLVGVIGYAASGAAGTTALVPAFFGVPMAVAGWMMARPCSRFAGLYSAVALAAILTLGSLRGVKALLGGDSSVASLIQLSLFVASIAYLVAAGREGVSGSRGGGSARPGSA
ncbi:hypothetical protein GBA65_07565 [Rubrobacter marinus]|uniref:Uncharacterized protein n=1 Tax=Rubrobacter marinus TaxID=2653852 RepID=A0A6G8PW60_9ACTN|nr:hypothetical protein [Rubrobacter marinus]QIN78405.1 hypothetical protein GBA65_07565 [Rubrobacter marinus]